MIRRPAASVLPLRMEKTWQMPIHATSRALAIMDLVGPILIALIFISLCSLLKEPNRRNFMAIMIAGAGAAYLNGGFGKWEFVFTAIVTWVAYRGVGSYGFIGVGWILHTGWDILHHLFGNPIVPFAPTSSLGCAICDPVIAAWCFAGAPSVYRWLRPKATPPS
jgi:hypothetical protein